MGTSGSLVLHSTTVSHGNFWFSPLTISGSELWCRGIGGGIVLIGPMKYFLFTPTRVWTRDLWISSLALYHCATVISGFHLWQFQLLNSSADGLVVVLFWLDLWETFFMPTQGFKLGTSGSLVLHSTTVPQQLHVFTSEIGGGIVLTGPVREFIFAHKVTSGFHLWQFQVFNSGAERLVVVLFWLDLWEIFILLTSGFELGTTGSLVLHYTMVTQVISGFHLWQFQVFNPGAEGLVVVLF